MVWILCALASYRSDNRLCGPDERCGGSQDPVLRAISRLSMLSISVAVSFEMVAGRAYSAQGLAQTGREMHFSANTRLGQRVMLVDGRN